MSTESWNQLGKNFTEHNSIESQCESLKTEIMKGTKESSANSIFRALTSTPISSAWGVDPGTIMKQERKKQQAERILAYKTALESYRTLCK